MGANLIDDSILCKQVVTDEVANTTWSFWLIVDYSVYTILYQFDIDLIVFFTCGEITPPITLKVQTLPSSSVYRGMLLLLKLPLLLLELLLLLLLLLLLELLLLLPLLLLFGNSIWTSSSSWRNIDIVIWSYLWLVERNLSLIGRQGRFKKLRWSLYLLG